MCAKFVYLILAGLFVFVVSTIAAFVYLEWWQALLASLATFVTLIYAAKVYVRMQFRGLRRLAEGLFTQKSQVLKGATVEVHSLRAAAMPAEVREGLAEGDDDEGESQDYADRQWAEIDMTVFPPADDSGVFANWDIDGLRLVPLDAPKLNFVDTGGDDRPEFDLWNVRLVEGGSEVPPGNDRLNGPRRLRFTVGVPRGTRLLKVQYLLEQFGRVELPAPLGLPPAGPR